MIKIASGIFVKEAATIMPGFGLDALRAAQHTANMTPSVPFAQWMQKYRKPITPNVNPAQAKPVTPK